MGQWYFALDPQDTGSDHHWYVHHLNDTIQVPGSWAEQGYGQEPASRYLWGWNSTREYEGAAWYTRDIAIPATWTGKRVELRLKGVRWSSRVWLDGDYVGQQESLSVIHRHDLTPFIRPGQTQRLALQIDNRMLYPLEESHINSTQTATRWGGITGGVDLIAYPETAIEQVRCRPDITTKRFDFEVRLRQITEGLALRVRVTDPETGQIAEGRVIAAETVLTLAIELGNAARFWSDDDPFLYDVEFILEQGDTVVDSINSRTGLREISTQGQHILLNGKPVFLRGYVDCCIFPQTGYPSWDIEHYRRQFTIARSYGFNHVRLHSWTPPEPFWQAADECGMLVQTELPHWSKHYIAVDVRPPEAVHQFLTRELEAIVSELSLHPSWVMFSNGNELVGAEGHPGLLELAAYGKTLDSTRLFTDQTGFGRLPAPSRPVDYFIQSCNWHPPKKIYDAASNDTTQDFSAITALADRPVIGHEHGQFTMYVRPGEAEKYTGPVRPTWLESIQESLAAKGIAGRIDDYVRASGVHMVRAYKENIERARRTRGLAGLQLLDIRDFPGQGHATTGILDMFWDSKGLIEPEAFARFNGAAVLLMRTASPTFYAGSSIVADIEISNFGGDTIPPGQLRWSLYDERDQTRLAGELNTPAAPNGEITPLGRLTIPVEADGRAREWTLTVQLNDVQNTWQVWTYPYPRSGRNYHGVRSSIQTLRHLLPGADFGDDFRGYALTWDRPEPRLDETCELAIADRLSLRLLQYLHDGGSVWLMPGPDQLYDFVRTRYLPPFWSYLHFPDNVSSVMGMIIQQHPALRGFPHDGCSNWQWYRLVNDTPAICLDAVPGVSPVVEVIDNFNRAKRLAYAFEARVGSGRLFVSTWRLYDPNVIGCPEAGFLLGEIADYLRGDQFAPAVQLSVAQVLGLFRLTNSNTTILE